MTSHDEEAGLGTVAALRRYPVKSMLGEDLRASDVTRRGLTGDRVLALVLSAVLGQPVTLTATAPPGVVFDRADPEEVLRHGLDTQVRVETGQLGGASPEGTFFDFAPLHLITTSALEAIAALSPRGTVELERYRPNIVIRTMAPGFPENDWVGRDLRVGGDLIIRVISRTPRCAIPTLEHGDLPRDTHALRVLAGHNRIRPIDSLDPQPCAGVYAQVLQPGRVQLGDMGRGE